MAGRLTPLPPSLADFAFPVTGLLIFQASLSASLISSTSRLLPENLLGFFLSAFGLDASFGSNSLALLMLAPPVPLARFACN